MTTLTLAWADILAALPFFGLWLLLVYYIGYKIGKPRGHGRNGGALSVILGTTAIGAPIAWLIIAFLPRTPEAQARFDAEREAYRQGFRFSRPAPPRGFPIADGPQLDRDAQDLAALEQLASSAQEPPVS